MSGCQHHSRIAAFHDGELDAASMEEMERHLAGCNDCTRELAGLREVSRAMSRFDPGEITPIELARLHRELDHADDSNLIRFSTVLATMAASVLIISLAWIGQISAQPEPIAEVHQFRELPEWQRLAMGEPVPAPVMTEIGEPRLPDTGVAMGQNKEMIDWMLDGLHGPKVNANR